MPTKTTAVRRFASLAEFIDYADGESEMADRQRQSRTGSESFNKSANWNEALTLAHGWIEGAKRVEAARVRITPKGQKPRRVARMREVGPGSLSMGNYLAGHPQPYVAIEETNVRRPGKGKVVRLLVNITASGMVSTDVIERRGAAVLALANALEHAGRRVEITAVYAGSPSTGRRGTAALEYRVTLKASQAKTNLPSLAFALAHPSMLRRIVFSAMEREDAATRQAFSVGFAYGQPSESTEQDGFIYLGCMHGLDAQWNSDTAATAWVIDTLKAQGVTLK